nr:histidine phosphatase family protein [Nereida sp. MMG025]
MVLRHGQTEWNREGRMQGALDSPLTALGQSQALAQNRILKNVDVGHWDWVSSPQGRARATAAIAAAGITDDVRTDPALVEIGVGAWSGQLRAECLASLPPDVTVQDGPDGALELYEYAPNGEGFEALRARCEAFVSALDRPSVLITHGITSRMIRAVILGLRNDQLAELPGGQGVVYSLIKGVQKRLE